MQYSDLAAFFRVWLKQLFPTDVGWDYDIAESAVDPQANGNGQYVEVLSSIFCECQRVMNPQHGRLIFTFHHWNPKGWTGLSVAIKRAGFVLLSFYVVHSENPSSVHITNQNALTHDAILVLGSQDTHSRSWEAPSTVNKFDSRQFTSDCATALGWMLNNQLEDGSIS